MKYREGGFDRVVGLDREAEAYVKKGQVEYAAKSQELSMFEREKTPEENRLIFEILPKLRSFIKEYGGEQWVAISFDQIHIFDEKSDHSQDIQSLLEEGVAGRYIKSKERIEILPHTGSHLHTAHVLVHELIHANSFSSGTFDKDAFERGEASFIVPRRSGISMYEKGDIQEELFGFMNEALTEELTKRFGERYFSEIDLLKDEFAEYKKTGIESTSDNMPLRSVLSELTKSGLPSGYTSERAHFVMLLTALYEKNKDRFDTYEDVFKVFASAMFNGELLPVARLIEGSFGKGSFRQIGESFKEKEDPSFVIDLLLNLKKAMEDDSNKEESN